MYFPKDANELKTILEDLQRFAQMEGMHRLSESLADARFEISRSTAAAEKGRYESESDDKFGN